VRFFEQVMNFSKTSGFRFISLIMLVSLFLISHLFGFEKASIPEEHENPLPPLSLIGVVVSEDSSSSVAVINNKVTGKTVILTVGESVLDMKLTHVLEDGIVLRKGEKIYWIFMGKGIQPEADKKIRGIAQRVEETDQENVQSKSSRVNNDSPKIEFIRSEVQRRVKKEWPLIIKDTKVIPNYADGKMSGFRVVSLSGKTVASEIGIHKDDVIREVNGVKLDSLSTLVSLYNRVFAEDRFEVLIERNKKLIRQVYTLR
jgi:type II secretory pathway component PulC